MKLVIEAEEGELHEKLDLVIERLRAEAHGHLCKAEGDDQPRELEAKPLQGSVSLAEPTVERIRRVMLEKLEETLKRAI